MRRLVLALACLTISVFAQDKPALGVLDVVFVPKITDDTQRELYTSLVRGHIIDLVRDSVDIIEGSKLERLIAVNAKSCNASSCLAQFAKTLGVDYLLGTRVISHKGAWSATVSLASSRSGMLSEKVADYESEALLRKGLVDMVSQAVKSLVKRAGEAQGNGSGAEQLIPVPSAGAIKVVVRFGSEPAGAAVSLDGKFLCQTPNGKAVFLGEHWIEMGKDGYRSKREKVTVSRNGQELSWNLKPIQTRLTLDAVDDRTGGDLIADVYVDGAKVGQTPYDGLVAVGAGRIEVAPEGIDRKTVSVTLEEGKAASAAVHFRSVEKMPVSPSGMVTIPAGCFMMGSPVGLGDNDEHPQHPVCISAFDMDATEVTQSAFQSVMGNNPSSFQQCGGDCPVERVSWNDASDYCRKVGKRLPTEAEWEYAARAGTMTKWYWGDDDGNAEQYAWSSGSQTHPVAQKLPNAWGLYDMAGNVWEWVNDWEGSYPAGSLKDPKGPKFGSSRVGRGGSWSSNSRSLRSSSRYDDPPDFRRNILGFRCVTP